MNCVASKPQKFRTVLEAGNLRSRYQQGQVGTLFWVTSMSLCILLDLICPVHRTIPDLIKWSVKEFLNEWLCLPLWFHRSFWHPPLGFIYLCFSWIHMSYCPFFTQSVSLPARGAMYYRPRVSPCLQASFGWKRMEIFEGREERMPACHPALKRVGWSRPNYHAMDLPHLYPKSPSECESRNYLHKFPMRIRNSRSQAMSRLGL